MDNDSQTRFNKRARDQGSSESRGSTAKRLRSEDEGPSCTVFLGNLSPDVQESDITEAFGQHGQIKEVRLIRHDDTGKAKGFGFLEFTTLEAAQRAANLQNVSVLGRPVKVEMSAGFRPPGGNQTGYGNQRGPPTNQMGNFDDGFNLNAFSNCNNPNDILNNPLFRLKFQQIQQGLVASGLAGTLDGQPGGVGLPPTAPVGGVGLANLGLGGLGLLNGILPNNGIGMGNIVGGIGIGNIGPIGLNPLTNLSPDGGDGPPMPVQQSRVAEPQRAKVKGSRTVFVGNLSDAVSDDTMFTMFGSCGDIESIQWLNDKKTQKFRGCAFLTFYDEQSTVNAVQLNGAVLLGRPMRVDFADDKGSGGRKNR